MTGCQEVRELAPGDYRGTLVTDRGSRYEAGELAGVDQQKCLSHLMRNLTKKWWKLKADGRVSLARVY
jgi:hypothetical protein